MVGAQITSLNVGGVDDQVAQFLTEGVTEGNPSYVAVVQSALRNGSFQRGVAAGIEIAASRRSRSGGASSDAM